MTMDKLKVAQVGAGNFGAYRRTQMRDTELFDLLATYDTRPEAMAQAQKEDGARLTSSYEELLDIPGLEGVVISTGAKFHARQAVAAMQRGLHVFVEKPLCASAAELSTLIEAQRQSGVVVGMGHTDHFSDKHSRRIRELIEAGDLGTLVAIDATTCHSGGMVIQPGDWRGDPDKNPGGMLFQCGVHKLHEMMFYCGPISAVSAMMRYDANSNTQTADAAVCNLRFENGMLGTLSAYHITPYRHTLAIYGTRANLYFEAFTATGSHLSLQKCAPNYDGSVETPEEVSVAGDSSPSGNLLSWFNAIRTGSTPYPSLHDGARAVAVVFAAEEAARLGQTVPIAVDFV